MCGLRATFVSCAGANSARSGEFYLPVQWLCPRRDAVRQPGDVFGRVSRPSEQTAFGCDVCCVEKWRDVKEGPRDTRQTSKWSSAAGINSGSGGNTFCSLSARQWSCSRVTPVTKSTIYVARRFITLFTGFYDCSQFWASWIHLNSLIAILMQSYHLLSGLSSDRFLIKMPYLFLTSPWVPHVPPSYFWQALKSTVSEALHCVFFAVPCCVLSDTNIGCSKPVRYETPCLCVLHVVWNT